MKMLAGLKRITESTFVAWTMWILFCAAIGLLLAFATVAASYAQEKPAAPAVPQSGMPVPAEVQELLADRDLLSAEIERIVNAEGDAVKIPVSLHTLSVRREAKTQRFLAWLDANKIPREWGKAGWRLDKWVFIPPPSAPAPATKAPEAKP